MAVIGKHGVTTSTPENILLGAGTWMKNLAWDSSNSKWGGDILGATNGGGKISIVGEFLPLEVDGALVKVKGLTVKQGGTVTAEVNFAEVTPEILKMGTLFAQASESDAEGFDLYQDKATISEGDYVENFGFVGYTANDGKQIIVILDYALCTSGIEVEPKNKEAAVIKLTMEAYAENAGNLDTLPVRIYYPTAAA